ncbi:response regulator [Pseudodesulfovibrio cashew]|uniref:Response regulator n=1 Tax=Pseudodesulfovibrio cashew TaxID=2678688 RepID=A0A6I6JFP1_9BACT|nr:response regulator [Pseudodesulfovibrio cashew]QGY39838.1 response regulator [Pseudodesulfovibrio cashew]
MCTSSPEEGKASMAPIPHSVLVVDDDESFRRLLCRCAEGLGCRLTYACDGEDAVDLFESGRFDLIVMDIIMPLMDGVDAIRAIRKLEAKSGRGATPILALSAESDVETGVNAMDAGATRMLPKSVGFSGLTEAMRDMLSGVP